MKLMHSKLQMSVVRKLAYFLCLQIKQLEDGISVNQKKHIHNMVKRFGLQQAKNARTPMRSSEKMGLDKTGVQTNSQTYRSIVGSLLYLTTSKPGVFQCVGVCARFQVDHPTLKQLRGSSNISKYF